MGPVAWGLPTFDLNRQLTSFWKSDLPSQSNRKQVSRWGHTSSSTEQKALNALGPFWDSWSRKSSARFLLESWPSISLYSPRENTLSYTRCGMTLLTSSSFRIISLCCFRTLATHFFLFLLTGFLPLVLCLLLFLTNHFLVPLPNIFTFRIPTKTSWTFPLKKGKCITFTTNT